MLAGREREGAMITVTEPVNYTHCDGEGALAASTNVHLADYCTRDARVKVSVDPVDSNDALDPLTRVLDTVGLGVLLAFSEADLGLCTVNGVHSEVSDCSVGVHADSTKVVGHE